uniref:gamma-glutamylcyclotransferase n=1 Tax=Colletotrichum fructicola (strain Nara gc5) TaxID=1213859 RepID=L2FQE2_COLFN
MQSDQADKPLLPKAGPVWYFAYGSNMRSSVMAGRSIIPQKTAVARIPTHVLTFDIFGFPYSEPSFASIAKRSQVTVDTVLSTDKNIPFESLPVNGVAYLILQEEYIRLVISEGGGVAYREIDVEAEFLNSSEEPIQKVIVSTLEAKYPFRPNAAPSARYLGLLETGAAEHSLPPEYQEYLSKLQCFEARASLLPRLRAFAFLSVWRPILRQLVKYMKANVSEDGHCEQWIENLIVYGYGAMWFCHGWIYAPLLGRGDGR